MRRSRLLLLPCLAVCLAAGLASPPVEAQGFAGPGPPGPGRGDSTLRYYLSNDLGMALEEIGWYRREEAEYVLAVRAVPRGEVRALLKDGVEIRRWEREEREERVYEEGALVERQLLDGEGRRLELQEFRAGELQRRTEFSYPSAGRITARVYDGEGNLLYTDRALLSAGSALREVRRESPEGKHSQLGLSMSQDRLVEERISGEDRTLVERYDREGRLFERERWLEGDLVERETLVYAGEGDRPAASTVVDYASGTTTRRSFDAEGRLTELEVRRQGQVVEHTRYERDGEGRTLLAVRRGREGLEQWRYEYDPQGKLLVEEYRLRGAVERVTRYEGEDRRVEELYREGAVFMRVVYEGGEKVREEFLRDGAVVRSREYP